MRPDSNWGHCLTVWNWGQNLLNKGLLIAIQTKYYAKSNFKILNSKNWLEDFVVQEYCKKPIHKSLKLYSYTQQ